MPRYFGGFRQNAQIEKRSEIQALEKGEDPQEGDTREEVMEEIARIIEWCYDHNVNYVEILKKVYPRYEWHSSYFDEQKSKKRPLFSLLKNNDFIWYYQSAFIYARNPRRKKPLSICFVLRLMHYNCPAPDSFLERVLLMRCNKVFFEGGRKYPGGPGD